MREVAVSLCHARHSGDLRQAHLTVELLVLLSGKKEESCVVGVGHMKHERPAEVPAEVFEAEVVFLASELVFGVEAVIAQEAVRTSAKVLCSALGDDVDLRPTRFSELCV